MSRLVSLLFDVEDPFDPASDDAALEVAEVVRAQGVRGTFRITGDKCRRLMERDRADVIGALKHHALGIHTDRHSLHPTTMEMLEDKGWEDGVAAAIESEGRAMRSFEEAFGRKPVCWGGGGNTWGPQIHAALKQLGIPALVYSQIAVSGGHVHEFCGIRSFPSFAYLGEDNMERPETAEASTERAIASVKGSDTTWREIFSGHPTRYRHTDWWDGPFYDGAMPDAYTPPPLREESLFRACMENLGKSIKTISEHLTILGLDDVLNLDWTFREPTREEIEFAEAQTIANVKASAGWPPNRRNLRTDRIEEAALAQMETLRILRT